MTTPGEAAEQLAEWRLQRQGKVDGILYKNGLRIVTKAAPLTPVDKGFLRRANSAEVEITDDRTITLSIVNRMVYAPYQHNKPHNHPAAGTRDHFIEIPFSAQIETIVAEIAAADMSEVRT